MEQQIGTGAAEAAFVDQHVEAQRGEIVGSRIDARVLLLEDDLQVGLALVAGLGAHSRAACRLPTLGAFERQVVDTLFFLACTALDARQMPLGPAQRAGDARLRRARV